MLELHQFELSQYSEKVRLILDYKGLPYHKIEVTPGVGQLEVYRISGQRQVPVLKDGDTVIADSTAIAKYLDEKYPDRPLFPSDPKQRALCSILEEWADESIGVKSRNVLFNGLSQDQSFRSALLPTNTPDFLKNLLEAVPADLIKTVGIGLGATPEAVNADTESIKEDLKAVSALLKNSPYLVGNSPCLADFAVAGLSILLKFPAGPYLDVPETLRGKGVAGIADNPDFELFFTWRDRLYADYRQPLIPTTTTSTQKPTSIQID